MARILIAPAAVQAEIGESFLDRRSFSVKTATDAADTLAVAREWKPDLIIFGTDMEGMTAEEFTRAVGDDEELADTRLLMVTGEQGGSGLPARVSRPVDRGELLEAIGSLLGIQIRRSRRRTVELRGDMEYTSEADGRSGSLGVQILRLSETGVLIHSSRPLRAGAVIRLGFSIPDVAQQLESTCIVLFVDEARRQYGAEFVDLDAQGRKQIRRYVADE